MYICFRYWKVKTGHRIYNLSLIFVNYQRMSKDAIVFKNVIEYVPKIYIVGICYFNWKNVTTIQKERGEIK